MVAKKNSAGVPHAGHYFVSATDNYAICGGAFGVLAVDANAAFNA